MSRTLRSWAAVFAVLVCPAFPLTAQQGSGRQPLQGVVLDAVTHSPLPNAAVRLDVRGGVLTDSLGRFVLPRPKDGPHRVAVTEFGYEEASVDVQIPDAGDLLRIELKPGPLALDGFTVVADRLVAVSQQLEVRRLSTGLATRVLGQDRLSTSSSENINLFLKDVAGIRRQSCPAERSGGALQQGPQQPSISGGEEKCIFSRGLVMQPEVFVDDVRRMDGIDAFEYFRPSDIYTIEVFSGGKMIRAYTNYYIERLVERPQTLLSIPPPQ